METASKFGAVSEPYWTEAFLIGGGPSLLGFDFERVRGRTVVAINDAVLHVPWATALFSLDRQWIRRRRDVHSQFKGEVYLAAPEELVDDAPVVYLQRSREAKLSCCPSCIHMGGNSGYGALNLAFLKRASTIYLLGYDMTGPGHWFARYPWNRNEYVRSYPKWVKVFDAAAQMLHDLGVRVFNCNPASRITAFPTVDIEEVLK